MAAYTQNLNLSMTCTATCLASTIALESILQNPIAKLPVITLHL
jgi:hypothetical protein